MPSLLNMLSDNTNRWKDFISILYIPIVGIFRICPVSWTGSLVADNNRCARNESRRVANAQKSAQKKRVHEGKFVGKQTYRENTRTKKYCPGTVFPYSSAIVRPGTLSPLFYYILGRSHVNEIVQHSIYNIFYGVRTYYMVSGCNGASCLNLILNIITVNTRLSGLTEIPNYEHEK